MDNEKVNSKARKRAGKIVDYKRVFNTEQGRRVLYDMMTEHKFFSPTIGAGDTITDMAFLEGQRNVVLRIIKLMNLDPEQVFTAIKEAEEYANTI